MWTVDAATPHQRTMQATKTAILKQTKRSTVTRRQVDGVSGNRVSAPSSVVREKSSSILHAVSIEIAESLHHGVAIVTYNSGFYVLDRNNSRASWHTQAHIHVCTSTRIGRGLVVSCDATL